MGNELSYVKGLIKDVASATVNIEDKVFDSMKVYMKASRSIMVKRT